MKIHIVAYRGKMYKVEAKSRDKARQLCKSQLYATAYGMRGTMQGIQIFNPH